MVGICTLAQQFLVKGPKKEKKTGLKNFFPSIQSQDTLKIFQQSMYYNTNRAIWEESAHIIEAMNF